MKTYVVNALGPGIRSVAYMDDSMSEPIHISEEGRVRGFWPGQCDSPIAKGTIQYGAWLARRLVPLKR